MKIAANNAEKAIICVYELYPIRSELKSGVGEGCFRTGFERDTHLQERLHGNKAVQ
jgi:hypothetical protein